MIPADSAWQAGDGAAMDCTAQASTGGGLKSPVEQSAWHTTIPEGVTFAKVYKVGTRNPITGEVTWLDITAEEG